jgi:lipoyl(octanoyl) transferase
VITRNLGRVDYERTAAQMRAFTDARTSESPDELWLVEHDPVFTQGVAGKPEHLLINPINIPVVKTDRGGQITYHGPGQAVVYVMFDLRRAGYGVRELVQRIENAVIEVLASYGVSAYGKRDAPGVYVSAAERPLLPQAGEGLGMRMSPQSEPTSHQKTLPLRTTGLSLATTLSGEPAPSPQPSPARGRGGISESKIASLGLKIRNGCSYHGVALNVNMDLSPFSLINPCGYAGLQVTHLHDLGVSDNVSVVGERLMNSLAQLLTQPTPPKP